MTATRVSVQAEVAVLLRHAACLERAAEDPKACPRVAARLRAGAALMRSAARLAGIPFTREHLEEATRG